MPNKFAISQESVIVVSQNDEPIAVMRKNGELLFLSTERMGFDEIYHLLCDLTGQPLIAKA